MAEPRSPQEILNAVFNTTNQTLKTDAQITTDIELGAVEIKNASTDDRAVVNAASTTRATSTNVVVTQPLDAAGTVGGVTMNTLLAGEDQTNDVLKTEGQFTYANVTTSGATAVKTAAGFLHALTFNRPVSGVTTVITDSSAAGGTLIGTSINPTGAVNMTPYTLVYDVKCTAGITLSQVSPVATGNDITVSYR